MTDMDVREEARTGEKHWRPWRWIAAAFVAVVAASSAGVVVATTAQGPISAPFVAEPRTTIEWVVPTATPEPAPAYQPRGPSEAYPAAYSEPLSISRGPRATEMVSLHMGPNENYVVVGTVTAGGKLEVVGRDESGEWIAVAFPPNSSLRGWVQADRVTGIFNLKGLPVEPVRMLP
jgi:uncharacterized protein YgiM (DUF1202 family)